MALDYDLDDRIIADTPQRMKALGRAGQDARTRPRARASDDRDRTGRPHRKGEGHGRAPRRRARRIRAPQGGPHPAGAGRRRNGSTAHRPDDRVHATVPTDDLPFFAAARAEADWEAMRDDCHGGGFTMRHARIPHERANEFVARLEALALEFSRLPREGDREYALLVGVFPTTPTRQSSPSGVVVSTSDCPGQGPRFASARATTSCSAPA